MECLSLNSIWRGMASLWVKSRDNSIRLSESKPTIIKSTSIFVRNFKEQRFTIILQAKKSLQEIPIKISASNLVILQ